MTSPLPTDPLPWVWSHYSEAAKALSARRTPIQASPDDEFNPRKGYSQKREDYP